MPNEDEKIPVTYELSKVDENKGDNLLVPNLSSLPECKVYKRRWPILVVFMLFSMISSMSWIQYSIITNIVMRYYNVSSYAVDWTAMIYMLVYIPLVFPAAYLVEKMGLRFTTLAGTLLMAVGSWIKVASIAPDRFVVAFIGHTVVGLSQVFVLNNPSQIAAVWFGPNQVSTACSLAFIGIQIGVALGFILPPMMIGNHPDIEDIGNDMNIFSYGMAISSTIVFIMTLCFFERRPPLPPSVAQALQLESNKYGFVMTIKRLMRNQAFVILVISYGICWTALNTLSTFLNQLILQYFEDAEEFAGLVGLVIVISGMFGSIFGGIVLDKTHKYKETALGLYFFSMVGVISFAFTLQCQSKPVVYATSTLLGFCMGGYWPVGFELAMELTYPEPEAMATGIMLFFSQTESFLVTLLYSWLLAWIGDIWTNVVFSAMVLVGTILTAIIPPNLRRQAAARNPNESM